jgi:hypothetical protein
MAGRITEESTDAISPFLHFGTIDGHLATQETRHMPRYTSLIGKSIQVSYRAGDILLSAAGVLVADSGQSIYLQEQFVQRGHSKTLRIEIPYPCIVRLAESEGAPASNQAKPQKTDANSQSIPSAQS